MIDFHTHNFPDTLAPRAVEAMVDKLKGSLVPVGDGTMATQLADMKKSGVSKSVVCPIATKPSQFQVILDRAKATPKAEANSPIMKLARSSYPFLTLPLALISELYSLTS